MSVREFKKPRELVKLFDRIAKRFFNMKVVETPLETVFDDGEAGGCSRSDANEVGLLLVQELSVVIEDRDIRV